MHAFTALALTLAGSVLAAPAITERATEQENFKLSVVGSEDLNGWAVLEAHVGAGTNAIEIQRPSAFQSEKVHLFGTPKQVNNGHGQLFSRKSSFNTHLLAYHGNVPNTISPDKAAGSKFAWVLPSPPSGQVEQVFSELGGGTNSFGVAGNTQSTLRLTADGSKFGTLVESIVR